MVISDIRWLNYTHVWRTDAAPRTSFRRRRHHCRCCGKASKKEINARFTTLKQDNDNRKIIIKGEFRTLHSFNILQMFCMPTCVIPTGKLEFWYTYFALRTLVLTNCLNLKWIFRSFCNFPESKMIRCHQKQSLTIVFAVNLCEIIISFSFYHFYLKSTERSI